MNWRLLSRMLGLLSMLVGGSMVFSLPWAFPVTGQVAEFESRGFWGLVSSILCSLVLGGGLYFIGRHEKGQILRKEALAVVGLGWIIAGLLGALPFLFSQAESAPGIKLHPVEALFESISGFTTTGASILTELEDPRVVPRCVMFWRSFTHWLGGMGIIVLFVAILGQLGAGGKALMKREVPGPITEGVRPRVQETALVMWSIYVGLTLLETVLLVIQGTDIYHALCHSFGTLATGGFSTWNSSIGHYEGGIIEWTVILFMFLAGVNFSLYFVVFKQTREGSWLGKFRPFLKDPEFRTYLLLILSATLLLYISLTRRGFYGDGSFSLLRARHALFTSVSIMTTTGFGTEDFTKWSEFSKGLLMLMMFIGGCAGSTGGGIKVIRWLLFAKVLRVEIERAYRPNLVRPIRLGTVTLHENIGRDVTIYFAFVLLIFVTSSLLLVAMEPDESWRLPGHSVSEKLLDCGSATASCLNNIGPGFGVLGPHNNYAGFSLAGKGLLTLLMLLGRLELFAILVLFLPKFWRNQ